MLKRTCQNALISVFEALSMCYLYIVSLIAVCISYLFHFSNKKEIKKRTYLQYLAVKKTKKCKPFKILKTFAFCLSLTFLYDFTILVIFHGKGIIKIQTHNIIIANFPAMFSQL